MASVSRPPWSKPTYPGGAPIRRDTVCRSMYSDMSKRMNSMPMAMASWRVTSVLPTPVGTGEQETADRLALIAQAGARHLDGGRQRIDGLVLAVDDQLEIALEVAQHFLVGLRHALGRDARHARHHVLDVPDLDRRLALVDRLQAQARAGLVDHVDGLVGHVAFVDVARRELGRRADRIVRCTSTP